MNPLWRHKRLGFPPPLESHVYSIVLVSSIELVDESLRHRRETRSKGFQAVWTIIEMSEEAGTGMVVLTTCVAGRPRCKIAFDALVTM